MRRIAILFLAGAACATGQQQQSSHTFVAVPTPPGTPGGATVGSVVLQDLGGHKLSVVPPNSLGADHSLIMPTPTGSTGCVTDSTGTGVLTIGTCGGSLTPPVVISGSTTGNILTVTQSGTGNALVLSAAGPFPGLALTLTGGASVDNFAMSGNFSGTHAQNIGILDTPTFAGIIIPSLTVTSLTVSGLASLNGGATLGSSSTLTTNFNVKFQGIAVGTSSIPWTFTQTALGGAVNTINVTDNGSSGSHALLVTGTVAAAGAFFQNTGGGLAAEFGNPAKFDSTTTFSSLGLGIGHLSSAGVLSSSAVSLTADVTGLLPAANLVTTLSGMTFTGTTTTTGNVSFGGIAVGSSSIPWTFTETALGGPVHTIDVTDNGSSGSHALFVTGTVAAAGAFFQNTGGGLSAEFANAVLFDSSSTVTFSGSLTGTHLQNLGILDSPTFASATIPQLNSNVAVVGSLTAGGSAILCSACLAGYYQDAVNGAYRALVPSTTNTGYYFQTNAGTSTSLFIGLGGASLGNVGVNTASPAANLEVNGSTQFDGNVKFQGTAAGTSSIPWTFTETAIGGSTSTINVTDNGSSGSHALLVTGTVAAAGAFFQNTGGGLAAEFGNATKFDSTVTFSSLGLGIGHLSSAGVLSSSAVSLTADVTGLLPAANLVTTLSGMTFTGTTTVGSSSPFITNYNVTFQGIAIGTSHIPWSFDDTGFGGAVSTVVITDNGGTGSHALLVTGTVATAGAFFQNTGGGLSAQFSNAVKFDATSTVTFSSLGLGIGHLSSAGVLSSSAVSLTADVTGVLPAANLVTTLSGMTFTGTTTTTGNVHFGSTAAGTSSIPWTFTETAIGGSTSTINVTDNGSSGSHALLVTGTVATAGAFFQNSGSGLVAEFAGAVLFDSFSTATFNGIVAGTHAQPFGTGDTVSFGLVTSSTGYNVPGWAVINSSGAVNGNGFSAGLSTGVSCSGTPTGSFASVNGIVTHC